MKKKNQSNRSFTSRVLKTSSALPKKKQRKRQKSEDDEHCGQHDADRNVVSRKGGHETLRKFAKDLPVSQQAGDVQGLAPRETVPKGREGRHAVHRA